MRLIPVLVMGLSLAFALPAAAAPAIIDDVRAMAFDRGIVKINEIEMEVEARTGRIIKLRRD